MIFKVLYQPTKEEALIRESTKTMYVDEQSERVVRKKLAERNYNIEYVQALTPNHLEYEQQSESYQVEKL
ncbi:DNA-dependent RNA polymerase subunit epsilon [Aureibacillus halotolerans]|uniref:DNA-directed RNA polymerase subunit epsilon n=1 Tax=Aureibacillus halotolerans TaxID=1508390 RepID=A0A4R6UBX6_9BACI|nr:RNA polymerase epsilon subunit [Aureibacillus halotolerans]TDQ42255.1 DNA-dependent RNA polymerase auxiliary subunit epsilon [Aureibacillus halotolerans]